MYKKIILAIFASLSLSSNVYAKDISEALRISDFHYYNGHVGLLVKQPVMKNGDACERSDWYMLEKTHPYYKEIVALVMTAHFTGQPLVFGIEGCVQGMPAIQHVISSK
ncbi:hypothetical protein J2X54_002632 [Duganella sp. 3397]|uniref:hypothetical protein n=1 Tax=Duganella sp. 3397 TaxID=2817732 RepID=UPI00285E3F5C|nr:hypothetical protein [Duganella sp. 3397]MDR7050151.1 hypothetical protein [Duganella sp. 3397]